MIIDYALMHLKGIIHLTQREMKESSTFLSLLPSTEIVVKYSLLYAHKLQSVTLKDKHFSLFIYINFFSVSLLQMNSVVLIIIFHVGFNCQSLCFEILNGYNPYRYRELVYSHKSKKITIYYSCFF